MRTAILSIMTLALFGITLSAGAADMQKGANETSVKVMTFNIRTFMFTDGKDFWPFRKDEVTKLVKSYSPDIIGFQEVTRYQIDDLKRQLKSYESFGKGRQGGKSGERCPIFYKKDRFELLDYGTFWLSESPNDPGSRSWDAAFPRIVTWGEFKSKKTGQVFHFFNTHFDHQGVMARRNSARLMVEKIVAIAGEGPAIAAGDFNMTDDTEPYQTMTSLLSDTRTVTETEPEGPEGTGRNFDAGSKPKRRIDYIFVSEEWTVKSYRVIDDTYGNDRRPSDHMPVMAHIKL